MGRPRQQTVGVGPAADRSDRAAAARRLLGLLMLVFWMGGCAIARDPQIAARLVRITPQSCRAQLVALTTLGPRFAGDADAMRRTRRHLTTRLRGYGYRVRTVYCGLEIQGVPQFNILAELPGRTRPEQICELGAHYDAAPGCPGADDNGSGVAGVLEVARVLAGARPEKTIRLCLFAAEELGLHGSAGHVAGVIRSGERVEGLLNLEMIGFTSDAPNSQQAPLRVPLIAAVPHTANFIAVVGNISSGWLGNRFEEAIETYVPRLRYFSANRVGGWFADAARSDHSSYWRAGLTGVMITDTANFRNPHYHEPTDTTDTIDFTFMSRITRAAAATMLHWAEGR